MIAAIVAVAAAGLHPAVRSAQRFLDRHGPPPDEHPDLDHAQVATPPPGIIEQPALSPSTEGVGPPTAQP